LTSAPAIAPSPTSDWSKLATLSYLCQASLSIIHVSQPIKVLHANADQRELIRRVLFVQMFGRVARSQRSLGMAKSFLTTDCGRGPFNWINGKRVAPADIIGRPIQNLEPRTGKLLSEVPCSGPEEVDRAVAAAREAFPEWRAMSGLDRGRLLTEAARLLRLHLEDLAIMDVVDNGKPIWEARVDMETVIGCLEYYGGLAPAILGQHAPYPGGSFAYVVREPYGVVGGVGAWNYPLQTCAWKAAPAMACGNTFVYKPSQLTPVTAVALGEILKEAGVPDGVFNVVQGEGETGALLAQHPGCDKLSFTGSVATGSKIMKAAAEGVRMVTLELGGKSPLIVFEDADLDNAVKGALLANFLSQGQVCSNGTRVFVHASIYDAFVEKFSAQAGKMRAGDPMNEETTVGATISAEHAEKVLGFVERARKEGAVVACGGKRLQMQGDLAGGCYLSPCVLANVKDSMEVAREEVFGSVASVLEFEDEEDVVRRANDTPYGLAAGVFTKDLRRGHRVIGRLNAGTCWINTFNLAPPEIPFGGFKVSGVGRENGTQALDFYTQSKTVYVELGDVDCGPLWSP